MNKITAFMELNIFKLPVPVVLFTSARGATICGFDSLFICLFAKFFPVTAKPKL